MTRTAGILLAGGRSTRYGSPKAFAVEQGEYYYERAYAALALVSDPVVIVSLDELQPRFPAGRLVIADRERYCGCGPLAGIYSGMLELEAERYVILPCDMPYITGAGLSALLSAMPAGADVCAARLDGRLHPLVSCWKRSMLEPLQAALDQRRYGVLRLLEQANTVWLDGDSLFADARHALRNINRPDQIE